MIYYIFYISERMRSSIKTSKNGNNFFSVGSLIKKKKIVI